MTANDSGPSGSGKGTELATFAGGCFWGMEELFRTLPGVIDTEVGYTGGKLPQATYRDVKKGDTGHAEALRIEFAPQRISYKQLLDFFFRIHNPTTKDRQGNDIGSQYRSAIFFHSTEQKKAAEEFITRVNRSGAWPSPVVTEILPASDFWTAEPEHQNYLQNYPDGYTCHYVRQLPSFLAESEKS
jgi:peptide-methionine (S)-S-oxide reductase